MIVNGRLLSVIFVTSPIALINVGITPIIRRLYLVYSLIFQYKGGNSNWGQDRNLGRVDQRDNQYDHYDNNNYRTDHQVKFCKVDYKSLDVGKGQATFSTPHSSTEGLSRKDSKGTCHFPRSYRFPKAVGTVNCKQVEVLSDTECTGIVVKRYIVSE